MPQEYRGLQLKGNRDAWYYRTLIYDDAEGHNRGKSCSNPSSLELNLLAMITLRRELTVLVTSTRAVYADLI